MTMLNRIIGYVLPNEATLFLASILFTLASFRWVRRLLKESKPSLWPALAFGVCNGAISVGTEWLFDGPAPPVVMVLVPLLTVLEIRLVSRDNPWSYLFIFAAFLHNFSVYHNLAVAMIGLWPPSSMWSPTSLEHRIAIFSAALLVACAMLTLLNKFMSAKELYAIIHSREKSLLLVLYMTASGTILVITTWITVPILYNAALTNEVTVPIFLDLLIKDFLILACSYMINFLQCRSERMSEQGRVLDNKLRQEKGFRSTIQQQAIITYVFNVTKNRVVEGLDYFPERLRGDPPDDYRHILREVVTICVHPDDREKLLNQGAYLVTKEQLAAGHNTQTLRFRMSAPLLKETFHLSDSVAEKYNGVNKWIWVDARAALVADSVTGDIISYIDLVDVDKQVTQEEELINFARYDAITGLFNRATLENSIRQYLSREDACGAMLMIDMDNFKMVNDSFGHQTGDVLLRDMADIIRSVFRPEDIIGRIGGDEFCVFTTGLRSCDMITGYAHKLLESAKRVYSEGETTEFQTTLSIGIAVCPDYGKDYDALYRHSDIALYRAKCAGKNTYSFYSGEKREAYCNIREDVQK